MNSNLYLVCLIFNNYLAGRATSPVVDSYTSDMLNKIVKLVDNEPNGPLCTLRLLSHKIQSPHEREALNSLNVYEFVKGIF